MTKPILADNIRQNLLKKYGSIADACRLMDLDYESCKKSLTRNTFSPTQLNILFHGVPINELQEKFTFRLARAYKKNPIYKKSSGLRRLFDLIDDEDVHLIENNQLIAEKIAELIKSKCDQIRKALS